MKYHDHDFSTDEGEVFERDPQAGIFETIIVKRCLICGISESFTAKEINDND